MDFSQVRNVLTDLPVPEVRYFDTIGSTNDEAMAWAEKDAPQYALVIADKQTSGRGRINRRWITQAGTSLAFSLVVRPTPWEIQHFTLFSPLAALALAEPLRERYNLPGVEVKWPNDVLIGGQKTAGILLESSWHGSRAGSLVVGMGVNVSSGSVPPVENLLFPAICIEQALGRTIDRLELLAEILRSFIKWRSLMETGELKRAVEEILAYKGEWVDIQQPGQYWSVSGRVLGIDLHGNLRLATNDTSVVSITFGDVHLRPVRRE